MQLNSVYTINYSQPADYHFSLDSIFLSQKINEWLIKNQSTAVEVIDVCAGSGVVGLELLFHLAKRNAAPKKIDFIEIQNQYLAHFEKNKQTMQALLNDSTPLSLMIDNYEKLINEPTLKHTYDLIVSNPPYFHVGQGKLSPSEFKNRCRHFVDSNFSNLLKMFRNALTENGSAFLLVRTDNTTTLPWVERTANQQGLAMEMLGDIRGAGFLRMSRLK